MKQQLLSLLLLMCFTATAQVTSIPDPAFEQELINLNIDSDGTLNGQVLTSDIDNITVLNIDGWEWNASNIQDLTGIQSFTNLQELTVVFTGITSLDVTQNAQLRILNCRSNYLTSIDVSQNALLEELHIGNVADINPWNEIIELDLSNNPNIRFVDASIIPMLEMINLRNGNNNPDMTIEVLMWGGDGPVPPDYNVQICVQVDDEEAAQTNLLPYSEWEVFEYASTVIYSENCALGTHDFKSINPISIYPNPTSDILFFDSNNNMSVDKAILFDISGRIVKEFGNISNSQISVAGLTKGVYVVQMFSGNAVQTEKVVVE